MGESRCLLCEGRIVNGRCEDCGMNYNRRKNIPLKWQRGIYCDSAEGRKLRE